MLKGFTCGSFDLLHPGHIIMFNDCKTVCDHLIIGVQSDPTLDRTWKNKPIQTLEERILMVKALKAVDEVITYETEDDLYQILKTSNFDVRIIGSDWEGKKYTGWDLPIKVYFHRRDHTWSTSELRKRVYQNEKIKEIS